MTTSSTTGVTGSGDAFSGEMPRCIVVQKRLELIQGRTVHARHSLGLWRWVFYSVGLAAVVAAAAAGASSLADIWGSNVAGFLALAAAVLASVDKFIGAGERIARLDRRWQSLVTLEDEANTSLIDAAEKESRLDPSDDGAIAAYEGWIAEKCAHLDAALKAINDRRDQV